jgi:hypothetical protein
VHPDSRDEDRDELLKPWNQLQLWMSIIDPLDRDTYMKPLSVRPKLRRRLDSHHAVPPKRQRGRVTAGASANIQDAAGLDEHQVQHITVDLIESDFLVLDSESIRSLAIPCRSPDRTRATNGPGH